MLWAILAVIMRSRFPHPLVILAMCCLGVPDVIGASPHQRDFRFSYCVEFTDLQVGEEIRIWLPIAPTNMAQDVTVLDTNPTRLERTIGKTYGNQFFYHAATPVSDTMQIEVYYKIRRRELRALANPRPRSMAVKRRNQESLHLFLKANRNVPVHGRPLELLPDLSTTNDVIERARKIYDRVDSHVTYDKSKPGFGNGDVLWVCASQYGNCTDFHSLFISMVRSQGIPARFEIGFPLPPQRGSGTIGGYHCWASFYTESKSWIPVDISEADKHPSKKEYYFGNLTEDRVMFSVGRDIILEPRQAGPALNYFIYPYAEVRGEAISNSQIKTKFIYADLTDTSQD